MMFSIFVTNERFFDVKKKTRTSIKNHENDQLILTMSIIYCFYQFHNKIDIDIKFFSTRAFKRRRFMIILSLFQSIVFRDRLKNDDAIEKFSNRDAASRADFSFFLFQNEDVSESEQYDNFDDFDFDIEAERFRSKF